MSRATVADTGGDGGLVRASERWVNVGGAALEPADAVDLIESAQRITQTFARAARHLSWLTPDSFVAAMRQAERSNDC